MKTLKQKLQWKNYLEHQLENIEVCNVAWDVEERYFLEGLSILYEDNPKDICYNVCHDLFIKYAIIVGP